MKNKKLKVIMNIIIPKKIIEPTELSVLEKDKEFTLITCSNKDKKC